MALMDAAGLQIGPLRATVQFDVDSTDTVLSAVVVNDMPVELEVLSPTGRNVVSRSVYPPGSFTTNVPKPQRFTYSTYDWSCSVNTRQ